MGAAGRDAARDRRFEVCRRLKADPATRGIKVIIVSARNTDQDIDEGMAAGADFYMTKPMRITDLSAKIKDLIG
ncbi:MAG: response regulator [Deltaproteobacteria bacterium]|nr:response regulator [Deltaproteobacteria bacterium]